jgi:hypothetical protein
MGRINQNILMENRKCSKPPTRNGDVPAVISGFTHQDWKFVGL